MMVIVPNELAAELRRRLDAEIAKHPEAEAGREEFYGRLLAYVNEHGRIPEFTLAKRPTEEQPHE